MSIIIDNSEILKNSNTIQNHTFASIGNGLKFDGVTDYVDVPFNSLMVFEKNEVFSLCFLFSPLSFKDQATLHDNTGTTGKGSYSYLINNNVIGINTRQDTPSYKERSNQATVPIMTSGNIYNVVFAYNNEIVQIFFNGVEYSVTSSGAFPDSILGTDPFRICQYNDTPGSYQANCIIYDLKMFDKALTQSEVTILYNSKNNLIPNSAYLNLVANYNFNQKETPGPTPTLIDSSGNNLNGTLINYPEIDRILGASNSWVNENGDSILV